MLQIKKIKDYIDKNRPYTQMPGYGLYDFTDFVPTDEEVLINMLEYMSYWGTHWMFDYMPKTRFCDLMELYLNDWRPEGYARQYKHILVEKSKRKNGGSEYKGPAPLHWIERTWEFQSRDMTDEEVLVEPNYWYQGVLEWCKKNPEGMRMLRELKLDRILDENKINE